MTVAVKLYSGVNWKNHFAMRGWVVPLGDTLPPTIIEYPHAIQISTCNSNGATWSAEGLSQAAIRWKLARQNKTSENTSAFVTPPEHR